MANGDLIKLGTLYLGGTKQPRPTRPWHKESTPPGAPSVGNVPSFAFGQTIEIRNTDEDDAYKIQWREVNDGGKRLLISDRVILASVAWSSLNTQGLITGKTITIDGQQYKLRVLTGGSDYRGDGGYTGGTPTNNEWDRIIVNEDGLNGIPTPTASDLDGTHNSTDFDGAHNQFWNWYYMYSWCQETYTGNSSSRVVRGFNSAQNMYYYEAANGSDRTGWRPVLEVLNSDPSLSLTSPTDNQTLLEGSMHTISRNKDFSISITADDLDPTDTLQYTVIRNTTTLKEYTNIDRNTPTLFTIPSTSLLIGNNPISVKVKDNNGGETAITFTLYVNPNLPMGYSCLNDLKPNGYNKSTVSLSEIINFIT